MFCCILSKWIYRCCHKKAHITGEPWYRPLFYNYPTDENVKELNNLVDQKEIHKDMKGAKYFNKFSNDTSAFSYLLTSLGYMLAFFDVYIFLFIYVAIVIVFIMAFLFDILKPLRADLKGKIYLENNKHM